MKIKDIARLSGLSVATVSRVINDDSTVSAASKEKIMRVIEQTGYIPNLVGRNLRTLKSQKLLVLLPTLSNPFYSEILSGIEVEAKKANYLSLICVTNADSTLEKKYVDMLKTKQVDGLISFFLTLSNDDISTLSEKYPIVQCCECSRRANTSYVMIDNEKAAYEAVMYLIKKGHKKIAMLSGDFYHFSEADRETGYKSALRDAGIEFVPDYLKKISYEFSSSFAITKELFQQKDPPTAIFCVSDDMAAGAVKYLVSANLKAGKDVDVLGFDNNSISQLYNPSISTIGQPRFDIGSMAVQLIIEKIKNIKSLNKGIVLPHELILRESAV